MPHFVQKELEKSSVTKGFVRQQALKEKGEKRARLFFLLLCCQGQQWLPPSPSLPDVCVLLKQEPGGGGTAAKIPGACPRVGWVGHTVPPTQNPCPWLCWELALGATVQPEIHCWEATALASWLSAEDFPWRFEITAPHAIHLLFDFRATSLFLI